MTAEPFSNRLQFEKSPYLQQHAHNPIDWYSWGDEAFSVAKKRDFPIFLSIGYSTCHWCHVMEKEVFSNQEVGKYLNDHFVSIKVDREEHPEIDSLYMDFAQIIMGGSGGWPLNLVLSSDLKPLLASTYLPLKRVKGMPSFMEFLKQVETVWNSPERKELLLQSDRLVEAFGNSANATGDALPTEQTLRNGLEVFFQLADPVHGGLKGEYKFPLGFQAEFLLNWSKLFSDSRALFYATLTLDAMQQGGVYDHIGGGFSRYAVDEEWLVPHFEKMLYDNAILARTYLQAWRCTRNPLYLQTSRDTLDYMIRDLMHTEGAFFSGEDADTEGKEGVFYTWTPEEIKSAVPGEDGDLFCSFYDITPFGNFDGRSILHIDLPLKEFAEAAQMSIDEVASRLDNGRKKVFKKRVSRYRPLRDEKILVSWNGLAIDVLALAGGVLQEKKYSEAAKKAVAFLQKYLWKEGKLLHRFCAGESRFDALLEDYAFLIKGLLTLFEQGEGELYLKWAMQLADILQQEFKEIEGSFYQTDGNNPILIRKCDYYDGAEPSGNAVHTENLLRLYAITGQDRFMTGAEDILKAARPVMEQFPPASFYHFTALLRYLDVKAPTVKIALAKTEPSAEELQQLIGARFVPHLTTIWKDEQSSLFEIEPIKNQTTVYICQKNRCGFPLTKYNEIIKAIEQL